jgi:hypothetical protein
MRHISVTPAKLWANGLWNPFTKRKRYTIQCGNCNHIYREYISFLDDLAISKCTNCNTKNKWNHSDYIKIL